jgi:predicted nucleic acid-binding protein
LRISDIQRGVITPQVVSDFVSVCGKRKYLSRSVTALWARAFVEQFEMLPLDIEVTRAALDVHEQHRLSIYDAQMWGAARRHAISTIVTEDLPGGRTEIDGVRYINPFARSFTFAKLGI